MKNSFAQILQHQVSRRRFLQGSGALALATATPSLPLAWEAGKPAGATGAAGLSSLTFSEVAHQITPTLEVPPDYQAQVLIRWGEPLFAGGPAFDPTQQTADKQQVQFGYNNDFIGYLPLPLGSANPNHGLLVVNHEYTVPKLMWPGSPKDHALDKAQTDVDIAAHGLSVLEIVQKDGQWQVQQDSQYTRRITPLTPMQIAGPAAGSARLKTAISQDGVHTLGTYGN